LLADSAPLGSRIGSGNWEVAVITKGENGQQRDQRRRILQALGARIRERRLERQMTQADLASSLRLSVAYVSLIERGGRNPPITTVFRIAQVLALPARDLC
jgi:DNA-binding XRE family transcriptional regulator